MSNEEVTFQVLAGRLDVGHGGKVKHLDVALDEFVAECATAANRTNSKASVTMTVTFDPAGDGELEISASVKAKVPEKGAVPITMYVNRRGKLQDEDPDQQKLPKDISQINGGK